MSNSYGIKSITKDGLHTVFIDFDLDESFYISIVNVLMKMQSENKLSTFYLFKTRNGYHAICLDKLELELVTNILYNYEFIDESFIYYNDLRGYYTLRFGDDKYFIKLIYSLYNVYEKSLAHALFLKDIINLPTINLQNLDNNYIFELVSY